MSTFSSQIRYDFSVSVSNNATGAESGGTFTLSVEAGTTDSIAIQLLQAMKTVSWPAGIAAQIAASRTEVDQTYAVPDLTASPPAFG